MPQNFSQVDKEKIVQVDKNGMANLNGKILNGEAEEEDRIEKSFSGQVLFISGGSGFLGKVLVEKLLRACPSLKKIYLLIRDKKGKSAQERMKDIFTNELFDLLKKQRGEEEILKQVEAICGDVTLPGLGLSEESRKILSEEVNCIYHCAATVRFDIPLRQAALTNTRGTKFMLDLAKQCKNLIFFGYVSTAYCHINTDVLLEKPYDPPADPEKIIKLCELLDDEGMASIEKKILGGYPNTYSFTKALAEDLVAKTFDTLPSMILRPSIVIPIWKEPLPGWTDNINGPTGLLIGAGKGVIRSMYCDSTGYGDYLPVDIAVNGIIIATWYTIYFESLPQRVCHMTSSQEIQVTWQEIIEIGRWVIENKVPLNGAAWYPGGSMKKSRFLHELCVILFHWIPAILVDILLFCLGYPPVLCRVQKRIGNGFKMFEYYTNRNWNFDLTEGYRIRSLMNETERKKYIIEKKDLDMYDYFEQCTLCTRRYILKTPDHMIPAAKRHLRILWVIDRLCKGLFFFWVGYYIYTRFIYKFLFDTTST